MKAKEFFTHLAEKSGIAADNKAFTDFIAANEKLEIPDEIANEVQGKLMNEDDAKKSANIAAHFKGQVFSTVDSELEKLAEDDETRNLLKIEKNSFKKFSTLLNRVKELESKKADVGKGDKKGFQEEIDKLNKEILRIQDDSKKQIEQKEKEFNAQLEDFALKSYFGQKNYANEKASKNALVRSAIQEVQEKLHGKARIARDGDKFKLVSWDNADLPYRENHKDISFDALTDKVLTEAGYLKVSEPPKPGNTQSTPIQIGTLKENDLVGANHLQSFYKQELAEFQKNGSH